MSNTRALIQNIALNGALNLNELQSDILSFSGYNSRNAPLFGGCLSPLWLRNYKKSDGAYAVSNAGDIYRLRRVGPNSVLSKNGIIKRTLSNSFYVHKHKYTVSHSVVAYQLDGVPIAGGIYLLYVLDSNGIFYKYSIESSGMTLVTQTPLINSSDELLCATISIEESNVVVSACDGTNLYLAYGARTSFGPFTVKTLTPSDLPPSLSYWSNPTIFVHKVGDVYVLTLWRRTGNGLPGYRGPVTGTNTDSKSYLYDFESGVWAANSACSYDVTPLAADTADNKLLPTNISPGGQLVVTGLPATTLQADGVTSLYYCDSFTVDFANNQVSASSDSTHYITLGRLKDATAESTGLTNGYFEVGVAFLRVVYPTTRNYQYTEGGVTTTIPVFSHLAIDYTHIDYPTSTLSPLVTYAPGYVESDSSVYLSTGMSVLLSSLSANVQFRLLTVNGSPYGLSVGLKGSELGVLCSSWGSISENPALAPSVRAINTSLVGAVVLEKDLKTFSFYNVDTTPEMRLLLGKYLSLNTLDGLVYDTEKDTYYNMFDDYNNRAIYGSSSPLLSVLVADRAAFDSVKTQTSGTFGYYVSRASSRLAFPKLEDVPYSGLQLPASVVFQWEGTTSFSEGLSTGVWVDCYASSDSELSVNTTAVYKVSYGKYRVVRDLLKGQVYPITGSTWQESLSLFAEYFNSYIGKDMVVENDIAYPLEVTDGSMIFARSALSGTVGISGLTGVFVIQGMTYLSSKDFIYSCSWDSGVLSDIQPVVSTLGLQFIGADTKKALFYSDLSKTIYSFVGDNTFQIFCECTALTKPTSFAYNPSTGSICVGTQNGCLVLSLLSGTYFISEVKNPKIQPIENALVLENSTEFVFVRMSETPDYARSTIKLATGYYGQGNQIVSKVDTFYLRLFDPDMKSGTVKLSVRTLTDLGDKTEEKTYQVKASDWDEATHTCYLRYQPRFQTSVGVSLSLESDFAIQCIQMGIENTGVTQITRNNI